jgi:hypothetical protein
MAKESSHAVSATAATPPDQGELPSRLGFRSGARGTHTSRTIMLADLETLLTAVPKGAKNTEYRQAITTDNALGKKTVATRRLSGQRLSELYGLDAGVPLFRLLRFFWTHDKEGRPILAFLCATARDPLLRTTATTVLTASVGDIVSKESLAEAVQTEAPGRFNSSTLDKIARNAASSWTQAGHLQGHRIKRRTRPKATAATVAYALVLGYLTGSSGQLLLNTFWTRILDLRADRLKALAAEASTRGWITYRQSGSVIEVRFPALVTAEEEKARHG